jgi:hypothetical protein
MTKHEKQQPISVFESAGRNACLIGVAVEDNPYRQGSRAHDGWYDGFKKTAKKLSIGATTKFFSLFEQVGIALTYGEREARKRRFAPREDFKRRAHKPMPARAQ